MRVKRESDALVVGAGPVGMLAALSLAERGLAVQIIDKAYRGSMHSYALALHPESLRLLDAYGIVDELLKQGQRVDRLAFYEGNDRVGGVDFSKLDEPFQFVLVVPQSALEDALVGALKKRKIRVLWNYQATRIEQDDGGVTATVALMEKQSTGYPIAHTEWVVAKEYATRVAFVVGADGYHSFVRTALGIPFRDLDGAETFAVYEFPEGREFQHEARVVFSNDTVNVVWPLGSDRSRWSFQVDPRSQTPLETETLAKLIVERAPWFGTQTGRLLWAANVMFERKLAERFGSGRVWLAGDAAHITGPIGAQSMNVGLSEAHDLAERMSNVHKGGSLELLEQYGNERHVEWLNLLGQTGDLAQVDDRASWVKDHMTSLRSCVPASGAQLRTLLGQIGVTAA